jgi:hypothetical protein
MTAKVGSKVHPRYKGIAEWEVSGMSVLSEPLKYRDPVQGKVSYDPRIVMLKSPQLSKVLWFAYWIATDRTKGRLKWGQGAPMLEEKVLLELLKDAIILNFFSKSSLKKLQREITKALKE